MKVKIEMTLSIGFAGARHREVVEVDLDDAPDGLSEDELLDWLHETYWEDWANGYIDGGVSIVERAGEVRR